MFFRILLLLGAISAGAAESERPYYGARPGGLAKAKALAAAGDITTQKALRKLIEQADKALTIRPQSVVGKTKMPPSGDRHDYMSLAPYFWPDPAKPDGLPYVRKDGEVNPESRDGSANDTLRMRLLGGTVETLALAYHFTKEEKYAAHAAEMLRVWFLAPETRMNPHLRFAQAITGVNAGRGTGILESRYIGFAADASALLAGSSSWGPTEQKAMGQWLEAFLEWLLTSGPGKDEAAAKNNHGSWFDVQTAQIALAVGRKDVAKRILKAVPEKRLAIQVEADGRQPLELVRTASFGYSCFNLEALAMLANFGDHLDVDIWKPAAGEKGSFRAALDFLIPYLDTPPAKKWPYPQIKEDDVDEMLPVLRLAALAYREPAYESLVAKHADARSKRLQLLFPR